MTNTYGDQQVHLHPLVLRRKVLAKAGGHEAGREEEIEEVGIGVELRGAIEGVLGLVQGILVLQIAGRGV